MTTNSPQVPLWTTESDQSVIDSSTPIMESPGTRMTGYDQSGLPRTGVVLSQFMSEGIQYTAIRADDGKVYTITARGTGVLLG